MLGELIEEGSPITLNAGDQPLAESSDPKVSGLTGSVHLSFGLGLRETENPRDEGRHRWLDWSRSTT